MDLLREKNLTAKIECDVEKSVIKKHSSPTAEMKTPLLRLSRKTRGKKREETYARPKVTSFDFGLLSFAA